MTALWTWTREREKARHVMRTFGHRAQVGRFARSFDWEVHRVSHHGRLTRIAHGTCAQLRQAKRAAASVIAALEAPE